ncbi:MAG: Fic family protein [Defluviitaleaceae bacterium]|nr:Fic family protein [Defluviitaleaceae bacterium]
MYEKLAKIYYKYSESDYHKEYEKRMNDYGAVQIALQIKPLKSNEVFQCFYVNHQTLMLDHEKIIKNSRMIEQMMIDLPGVALSHYVHTKLVNELVNTNKIEGIRSTKAEMRKALQSNHSKKKIKYRSFVNAYRHLLENRTWTKIETIDEIRKIYDELVANEVSDEDQLDGELFRKTGVEVVTGSQRVLHKGIEPESSIKAALHRLIMLLNDHDIPGLYRIAIAHYYFGYIHPYYDGNGRTARYISSLYLKNELDILTALTLSYAIEQNKKLYYDGFEDASHHLNKGELTHFCQSFFKILLDAQTYILDELLRKTNQLNKLFSVVEVGMAHLHADEKEVLEVLGQHYLFGLEGESFSKKELEDVLELSAYKVSKAIDALVKREMVRVVKKKPFFISLTEQFIEVLALDA